MRLVGLEREAEQEARCALSVLKREPSRRRSAPCRSWRESRVVDEAGVRGRLRARLEGLRTGEAWKAPSQVGGSHVYEQKVPSALSEST